LARNPLYLYMAFAIVLLSTNYVSAQAPDTTDFYYRLHNKAKKRTLTRWIYEGIFRNPVSPSDTSSPMENVQKANDFLGYQGKIVRNIRIVSLDPFGYSVNDTFERFPNNLEKAGNKYHINTRKYIIRNILLFKRNTKLDPLELSESERLLRLNPYVNDARIYVSIADTTSNADSVDVTIMVQDKWSVIIGSSLDVNNPNIKLRERNLFGLGHQLEEGVTWHPSSDYISTAGSYTIFNIGKTFINSSVFYSDAETDKQWGARLDRPFYSPLAKWAGGASYTHSNSNVQVLQSEVAIPYSISSHAEDIWIAKSFPVTQKKTSSINKRSDSYMTGLRFYHLDYMNRLPFTIDSNMIYRDQTMILNNIGFTKRKYYKDHYLFRFGANEDIPQGYSIEYVHGILDKEAASLWYYSGLKLAVGRHYDRFGYLSMGISGGTFYNKTFVGSGVVNADMYYFSNLYTAGKWYFRQFFRWQYTQGINRQSYESININGSQMYGFKSDLLSAKNKMVVNLEFVMYAPYQVIGFKFAPVLFCGFARAGDNTNGLVHSYTYQAFALGLLIRNEHLITNTFEVSIGLYPYIPDNGSYIFKFNPVGSYNIKARDYNIGKPELVPYQ
jgi:hypothetical protein